MIEKIKALLKNKEKMRELITYVIFGVLTTLVNWVVYLGITKVFGMDSYENESLPYLIIINVAQILGWILSVLFAYFTNKKYVFQSDAGMKNGAWKEFFLFVSARIASLLIFDLALFNILHLLGVNDKVDKLIMNVLVVIFNYVASRYVVFKKKEKEKLPE